MQLEVPHFIGANHPSGELVPVVIPLHTGTSQHVAVIGPRDSAQALASVSRSQRP